MNLRQIELSGISICERQDTYDQRLGYTWDADVAIEVISNDTYRLRAIKALGLDIRTIVDIGGNIGTFVLFANHLWPDAKITVVEPFPENCEMIRINCKNVKGLNLVQKAIIGCSHKTEKRKFLVPSFRRDSVNMNAGDGRLCDEGDVEVDVCGLLDVLPEGVIDILKIDCEGQEIDILREAEAMGLFKRIRIIRGETHSLEGAEIVREILEPHYWFFQTFRGVLGAFSADTRREM